MFLLYFFLFYILGIILWITRKYDLFTISIIFVICSIFLYFGNIESFIYILIFFSVAEGMTLILNKKHKKRSYKNLLGNCLAGCIFILFGQIIPAITSICASFSDTISSEIGILSKRKPRLITNFKKVEAGTDGGVSALGIISAAIVGALTIIYFLIIPKLAGSIFIYKFTEILIIGCIGFIGSIIDSYIGATIEQKGYSNNYQTNFLASFLSGTIAFILINIL
jgi:uncharacterized protein (TIGR00297 family)